MTPRMWWVRCSWWLGGPWTGSGLVRSGVGCSVSRARGCWRAQLGVTVKKTRPYRPKTNGKVERFHPTMTDEWAYAKPYQSETARRAALPAWLHAYNNHRHHTALGGPPSSRVPNLSGQNT